MLRPWKGPICTWFQPPIYWMQSGMTLTIHNGGNQYSAMWQEPSVMSVNEIMSYGALTIIFSYAHVYYIITYLCRGQLLSPHTGQTFFRSENSSSSFVLFCKTNK
jgi:hypothetical protein